MRVFVTILGAAAMLGGCSANNDDQPAVQAAETASAPAATPAAAKATEGAATGPASARSVKVSNDLYEFEYGYPAAAAAIPDLRKWLDADIDEERADLIKDAREQRAMSKQEGFPFNPLGYWADWKVVTDLPGWLSLSGSVSTYEGGAHPNHGFTALVWDKQANQRREPEDMFTSEAALSRAIRKDFCRLLDRERAKRRGEPVKPGSEQPFSDCIDPVENTVILGSSNGKAFDRIGILVAPYAAGPYAEGEYEVTLPVTEAVMAAVKPEFRPTFVKAR